MVPLEKSDILDRVFNLLELLSHDTPGRYTKSLTLLNPLKFSEETPPNINTLNMAPDTTKQSFWLILTLLWHILHTDVELGQDLDVYTLPDSNNIKQFTVPEQIGRILNPRDNKLGVRGIPMKLTHNHTQTHLQCLNSRKTKAITDNSSPTTITQLKKILRYD